jgi:hypothetical protein
MLARGVFSFYPPRLHASSCFPSKPFVSPTCEITVRNFFVSPTYAKTGGCTPPKNVGAPTFALSFLPIPTLGSLSFQLLAHSFIFRITRIPYPSRTFRTLCRKTGGTPNSGHTNASALSFVKKPLLCVPSQRTQRLCGESLFLLATSFPCHSPFTSVGTQTSPPPAAAACSSDASICAEPRRALRRAAAALGRTGGRGGRDRRGECGRIFRSGRSFRRRSL